MLLVENQQTGLMESGLNLKPGVEQDLSKARSWGENGMNELKFFRVIKRNEKYTHR